MERRIHDFLPEVKDYYVINSDGEIFSVNCGKMKTRNKLGTEYQIINLTLENGKKKTYRLHRLVMLAFRPNENSRDLEVNHIDGNKLNNRLENLEWCTASENQRHAFRLGLQKPRCGEDCNLSKLKKADVLKVFEMNEQGYSKREIAETVGCSATNIDSILKRKSWKQV